MATVIESSSSSPSSGSPNDSIVTAHSDFASIDMEEEAEIPDVKIQLIRIFEESRNLSHEKILLLRQELR